jgi:hypothetical protein
MVLDDTPYFVHAAARNIVPRGECLTEYPTEIAKHVDELVAGTFPSTKNICNAETHPKLS